MTSETRRLRLFFLLPLLLVFVVTTIVLVADASVRQQRDLRSGMLRLQTSAKHLYEEFIDEDAQALKMAMRIIERDQALRDALANRDRNELLSRAKPIFNDMKNTFGITHFYFTTPDRKNLLRVHQPERYGDTIDRVTTRLAERSGSTAYGVELGPLGTFTLRLVSPWYSQDGRTLLGFVELGMEIDEVLDRIRKMFGVELLLAIKKEYLDRPGWENGMRMLGRTPNWDRFPNVVINVEPALGMPPAIADRFAHNQFGNGGTALDALFGGASYRALFLPLNDAGGNNVAEAVLLTDVSKEQDSARRLLKLVIAVTTASSAALFAFFYGLVGWVGRRIDRDQETLQELASHDGLTGLYNYRAFYSILEREVARAKRYPRPVSLLMLDIDHFKKINDTFGHTAGDRILEGLARLLQQTVRSVDSVSRCGGEEIAILLPETDAAAALQSAERLRAAVEKTGFDTGSGRKAFITISIGVAAFPEQVGSVEELVKASDAALYAAKKTGRNRVALYEGHAASTEAASAVGG